MSPIPTDLISDLPGTALVQQGLKDYHENRHTMHSCLVRMARPRLAKAGFMQASQQHDINAELDLYHLLSHEGNQAHSRYNALVREIISFEHALDHRLTSQ
jgi:hypothetical protein